jgi:hypothetical protein
MAQVTLQVYHSNGAAGERTRKLVETRRIDTGSNKALTARRAGQIITREYPAYARVGGPGVIRTKDGWLAMRSLNSTERCDYHFIWEEVAVREE